MSWILSASGTTAALTINSELTLATDTNNATFQPYFDLSNMANGDATELRIYMINLSGGSLEQCWKGTYANAGGGSNVLAAGPMLASDQSYRITIKQVSGTGRTYGWKLLRA